MTTAIIVAGGESSRFGSGDKALATIDGVPMIRRVVNRIVPLADHIVVNSRTDQRSSFSAALSNVPRPIQFAIDRQTNGGPVAGLETALDAVSGTKALVLACDLPLIRTATLSSLLEALEDGGGSSPDCVLPLVDGYPEPLCGVYSTERLRSAIEIFDTPRNRSFGDLLENLRVSTIPQQQLPGGSHTYENVNTPEDLRTVRTIVRKRREMPSTAPPY
ncbi:MAG: molybdenum cofactor guanylyltransferase [Natronomonas sp.]